MIKTYIKHNNQIVEVPYSVTGNVHILNTSTLQTFKDTNVQNIIAFKDRGVIKYIDMNTMLSTDTIWGRYVPLKEVDVIWGNYDSGGGNVRYDLDALNDFNIIDQYFMIEKNWHKLQGADPGNLQSYLTDANDQLMDNPEFIIDIYYKLIVARPDNWGAAVSLLNPSGRLDTSVFNNYGFTPTFSDDFSLKNGAYYENPIAPFDLPADSVLKDGYTSVQFPDGKYFDYVTNGTWNGQTGPSSNLYMEFLGLAGRFAAVSMMPICEMYTQDVITYTIDETAASLGIPYSGGGTLYMPKLFTGMLAGPSGKNRNGILYLCLGVHHI